jgi:hypothetical protein
MYSSIGRDISTTDVVGCAIGTILDDSGNFKRAAVSFQSVLAGIYSIPSHDDEAYSRTALMSLEGLFRPYSVDTGAVGIAHFESPSGTVQRPTVNDLNPFGSGYAQCDIDFVTSRETVAHEQNIRSDDPDWFQARTARGIALKGPLIVTGWGYDTNDKPVPNSGVNTDRFLPDYRLRCDQWKTGPVDLRWDNSRKVWAVGSNVTVAVVVMLSGSFPQPHGRPRYIVRPIDGMTTESGIRYTSTVDLPIMHLTSSDKIVFNIQEGNGDIHTLGSGSPVILHNAYGMTFFDELQRSFARRTVY